MEVKNLQLKKGYQQEPVHLTVADFKFGNSIIRYTHALLTVTNPDDRQTWIAFLMRTIETPGQDTVGEMIKTWVGRTTCGECELTDLINKDRKMLVKQILQEDNEE